MSPIRVFACAAVAVFLIGFGGGFYGLGRLRDAEATVTEAREEIEALRTTLETWRKRAEEAESRVLLQQSTLRSEPPATGGNGGMRGRGEEGRPKENTRPAGQREQDAAGGAEGILAADPEYLKLRVEWYRSTLGLNYGPIYRKLGLSAEQIAAVETAMVGQYEENMDARAAAVAQGLSPSDASLSPLTKSIGSGYGRKMVEVLGPQLARDFFAQTKLATLRAGAVDPLAGSLYYTDAPLTLAQAEQLTQIVATNTSDHRQEGLVYSGRVTNWEAVLEQAAGVLSPAQLTAFRAQREREVMNKRMAEVAARLMRDAQRPKR